MIRGVNYQPGLAATQTGAGGQAKPRSSLQEAIKVLSLRMPKVVGPHAVAPAPLLTSAGSGGNPLVDSVVNTVLSRAFPQGQAPQGQAPVVGQPGPGESGTMPPSPPVRYDAPIPPMGPSAYEPLPGYQPPSFSGDVPRTGGGGGGGRVEPPSAPPLGTPPHVTVGTDPLPPRPPQPPAYNPVELPLTNYNPWVGGIFEALRRKRGGDDFDPFRDGGGIRPGPQGPNYSLE